MHISGWATPLSMPSPYYSLCLSVRSYSRSLWGHLLPSLSGKFVCSHRTTVEIVGINNQFAIACFTSVEVRGWTACMETVPLLSTRETPQRVVFQVHIAPWRSQLGILYTSTRSIHQRRTWCESFNDMVCKKLKQWGIWIFFLMSLVNNIPKVTLKLQWSSQV